MLPVQVKSHDKQLRQSAMGDATGHPAMRRAVSGCSAEGRASSSSSGTTPCSLSLSPAPSSEASLASTPRFSPWMDPVECVDAATRRSAWSVVPAQAPPWSAAEPSWSAPTWSEAEPSSLSARAAHPPRIEIPPPRAVGLAPHDAPQRLQEHGHACEQRAAVERRRPAQMAAQDTAASCAVGAAHKDVSSEDVFSEEDMV